MPAKSRTAAPADTTVPAPQGLSFTDDEVPATTREPKANPFTAAVQSLKDSMGDNERSATAKSFVVPADQVSSNVTLLQKAARSLNVSARNRQTDNGNGSVKVTFWTVKAIKRTRKDADNK